MAKHQPEYIADYAYTAARLRISPKHLHSLKEDDISHLTAAQAFGRSLSDYELYSFDRSAINAARDLRMDTPERVDRLVEAVLRSPRRIFLEADLSDLQELTSGMRDFLFPPAVETSSLFSRWGALIDIEGEGRARFRIIMMTDKDFANSHFKSAGYKEVLAAFNQPDRAKRAMRLSITSGYVDIDISRHVGFSKQQFEDLFEKIQDSSDPIFSQAASRIALSSGPRERSKIIADAWRAARFRDIVRHHPGDPAEPLDAMFKGRSGPSTREEHNAAALRIIAMLAVLQADADDLVTAAREPQPRRSRSQRKAGAPRARDMAPGLSVVTLNLEDRHLQQIYEQKGGTEAAANTSHSEEHSGRVRHPVRGHLFLARNNKLTWRKPHWRGSLEKPTLRRVVAPSHKS
jgi:hypothetical protein